MEATTDMLRLLLLAILLALHLVCVNIAAVGPLACIGLACRERKNPTGSNNGIGRWLAWLCCSLLLVGMLLGGLEILVYYLSGERAFFEALHRVPHSRLHWAPAELLFYFVCMLPVAIWWKSLARRPLLLGLLALLAATNLIYHFAPLFVIITQLKASGAEVLTGSQFRERLLSAELLARVTHHLLSAVAVVAMVLALRASRNQTGSEPEQNLDAQRLVQSAARWAMAATLLEIPSGIWFLSAISESPRTALLGGAPLVSAWFVVALVLVFLLLQKLFAVAAGETDRRSVTTAAGLLLAVIVLMSGLLHHIGAAPL